MAKDAKATGGKAAKVGTPKVSGAAKRAAQQTRLSTAKKAGTPSADVELQRAAHAAGEAVSVSRETPQPEPVDAATAQLARTGNVAPPTELPPVSETPVLDRIAANIEQGKDMHDGLDAVVDAKAGRAAKVPSLAGVRQATENAALARAQKKAAGKKAATAKQDRAPKQYHAALADFPLEIQRRYTGHAMVRIRTLAEQGTTETLEDALAAGLANSRNLRGGKAPASVVTFLGSRGLAVNEKPAGNGKRKGKAAATVEEKAAVFADGMVQAVGGKRAKARLEKLASEARSKSPDQVGFYEAALRFVRD